MVKHCKLILSILFSTAMIVCCAFFGISDSDLDKPVSSTAIFWNEYYEEYMSGVDAEMEVYDPEGLAAWFWGSPGGGDTIYLTDNIDMSEYYWPTVPVFEGITIEGNGYAITGIRIDFEMMYYNSSDENMRYALDEYGIAMIACMRNCTINDLVISGSISNGSGPAMGSMAAQAEGCSISGLVANFSINGSVTEYAGGLIGKATDCDFERMGYKGYFGANGYSGVGGLVGYSNTDIVNSYFYAQFFGSGDYCGCIVGVCDSMVSYCYAAYYSESAFSGTSGGIAGKVDTVNNCFAAPCARGNSEYVYISIGINGGIAGEAQAIDMCYWSGQDVDSPYTSNSIGKLQETDLYMAIEEYDFWENSLGFDSSIWGYWQVFDSNYIEDRGFPFLQFETMHQLESYTYYTVTFNGNGGTNSSGHSTVSVSVVEGATASCPDTFTRSGYVFNGWNGSLSNVTSNRTVYAIWVVAYTITYDGNGGKTSNGSTIITQTVGKNLNFYTYSKSSFIKTGYKIVNWSTTKSTSTTNPTVSGSYTGVSTGYQFTANANITLYAVWGVDRDFEIRMQIYIDSNATGTYKSLSTNDMKKTIESFTITYYYDSNGTATASTSTSSQFASWIAITLKGMIQKQFTFTFVMKSGYDFIGYKRFSTLTYNDINSSSELYPTTTMAEATFSFTPSGLTDDKYLYVFVRKTTSNNKLKFDSAEKYYYFEDGYFPQSYVGDSLNSTLNNASSASLSLYQNLQYLDGNGTIQTIPVYTYGGNKYAKATKNGTNKWFKMEAIRWRVSDYGATSTTYPTAWRNATSKTNFKVVSDRILWFGAVTTTETKESWDFDSSEMASTFANLYVRNGETLTSEKPIYAASYNEKSYYFGETGQQTKVKYTTKSVSGINIATQEEVKENLTDMKAKVSDMVAFVMGIDNDSYVDYWTRELGINLRNGKVITSSGIDASEWLQNFNGVRFSLRMSEGSKF